jgi:hypothetical protein
MPNMAADPLIRSNFVDSCAFDPKYEPETSAANEIFRLFESGHFLIQIAHSTQKELDHPNTPVWVRAETWGLNYTLDVSLTANERRLLGDIRAILAGEGKIENILGDAQHVFETQKYGLYFIITDKRILSRAKALQDRCGVVVVRPSEFLAIAKHFIAEKENQA